MAKTDRVKGVIGLSKSFFAPITANDSADAHPTYGDKVDLGSAVKAYLSVKTADLLVHGDNGIEIQDSLFAGGTLDQETLLNSLELDSKIYGSKLGEDGSVTDADTDAAPEGCVGYIQEILKKDKTRVYRGVFFYRASATTSARKDDADTRKDSIEYKNNAISWAIMTDNTGAWRDRAEFPTMPEAETWLETKRSGGATPAKASVSK